MHVPLISAIQQRFRRAAAFPWVPTHAKRLDDPSDRLSAEVTLTARLRDGDYIVCVPGDVIPADGEIVSGTAAVEVNTAAAMHVSAIHSLHGVGARVVSGARVTAGCIVLRLCTAGD
jgi:K+-transporting ATPase ATPase B chain